jgi:hypothetical protein
VSALSHNYRIPLRHDCRAFPGSAAGSKAGRIHVARSPTEIARSDLQFGAWLINKGVPNAHYLPDPCVGSARVWSSRSAMSLVRSWSSRAKGSSVSAYEVAVGHSLCGGQVLAVGAPLRSGMGSWTERVANLRASRRSAPLTQAARQRLGGPNGSLAFLHLMPSVHKVIPAIAAA